MCEAATRWVQREILAKNPEAELQIYAVWFSMLYGDSRERWDSGGLEDPRVIHLWDEDRIAGRWFAEQEEFYAPVAWDAYYLYDSDARWSDTAPPLESLGSTILSKRDDLQNDLLALLARAKSG